MKFGHVLKKAHRKGKRLFLLDETGFYLLAGTVRSYERRGRRQKLRVFLTNDHVSVIGGITPQGEISVRTKNGSLNAIDVVWSLRGLIHRFPEGVIVVWDGSQIHGRSTLVKRFVKRVGHRRLEVKNFPGYAPDLNPTEGLWQHLKNVELRNVCTPGLVELATEVRAEVNRLRAHPDLVQSFFGQPGLEISEFQKSLANYATHFNESSTGPPQTLLNYDSSSLPMPTLARRLF